MFQLRYKIILLEKVFRCFYKIHTFFLLRTYYSQTFISHFIKHIKRGRLSNCSACSFRVRLSNRDNLDWSLISRLIIAGLSWESSVMIQLLTPAVPKYMRIRSSYFVRHLKFFIVNLLIKLLEIFSSIMPLFFSIIASRHRHIWVNGGGLKGLRAEELIFSIISLLFWRCPPGLSSFWYLTRLRAFNLLDILVQFPRKRPIFCSRISKVAHILNPILIASLIVSLGLIGILKIV